MEGTASQSWTHHATSWLFRHGPVISVVLLLSAGLVFLSVCSYYQTASLGEPLSAERSIFYLGFFVGMALCLALIPVAVKGYPEYSAPVRDAINSKLFFLSLLVGIICVALFAIVANFIEPSPGQSRMSAWWMHLHHDPGGIFAAFTGVVTIYTLLYTVGSIRDIRRTVSSFSELIDRVHKMAGNATDSNPLRILAYTPAIGFLALRKHDWDKFHKAVTTPIDGKPMTNMVCLEHDDLDVWHQLFVDRRTLKKKIELQDAKDANTAAENLLRVLGKDSLGKDVPDSVHRLPWRFMPGFYLFFTRERAIIVVPLFLPFPKGAPKSLQEELPSVQMIGLETQDRSLISDVEKVYGYYLNLPVDVIPDSKEVVRRAQLEDWVKNPSNADSAMRNLRDKLLANFASANADYKSGNEFELTLGALMKTWQ